MAYEGAKFRPTGRTYTTTNRYGETVVRDEFVPTTGYAKWLKEEKERKRLAEIEMYKNKLQLQFEKYGEVDEVDFQYYLSLINMSTKVTVKRAV